MGNEAKMLMDELSKDFKEQMLKRLEMEAKRTLAHFQHYITNHLNVEAIKGPEGRIEVSVWLDDIKFSWRDE